MITSIIKEKKFIDTVSGLTIFIEKKNVNDLEKIILKDRINQDESQIIVVTLTKPLAKHYMRLTEFYLMEK